MEVWLLILFQKVVASGEKYLLSKHNLEQLIDSTSVVLDGYRQFASRVSDADLIQRQLEKLELNVLSRGSGKYQIYISIQKSYLYTNIQLEEYNTSEPDTRNVLNNRKDINLYNENNSYTSYIVISDVVSNYCNVDVTLM